MTSNWCGRNVTRDTITHAALAVLMLLLGVCPALSQQHEPDTYDRLFALPDSLRVWAVSPPPDTVSVGEIDDWADYLPIDEIVHGESDGITLPFNRYMEMNWGGLRGAFADSAGLEAASSGLQWKPTEDGLSNDDVADRLTWLRTLSLPSALRAPVPDDIDSVRFVLHGRDIDRITMPFSHAASVLAWMARGREVCAASLSNANTDSAAAHSHEMDLFVLIVPPAGAGHHALKWRETNPGLGEPNMEQTHLVRLHLYPFIPTASVSDLFADPDVIPDRPEAMRVGPGTKRDGGSE